VKYLETEILPKQLLHQQIMFLEQRGIPEISHVETSNGVIDIRKSSLMMTNMFGNFVPQSDKLYWASIFVAKWHGLSGNTKMLSNNPLKRPG